MDAQPDFDEALRRQRDVFRDRYEANDSLRKYMDDAPNMEQEDNDRD